ncbi:isocitrate lyase/phosphoenolpyruvate mutase family protein [Paradesertivirga mongoliensis]|uniref:Isocitrate lyase/phosphoenolpyruvate mutase family protein n=1 Tax=Paradesertivirga mongoliensis TaxID=2100740 RepID=A0ABW4ZMJ8_9SPHI|nr:isocitrate lyase/phosphoenolpyruvate mutase family protein [Pedobacter mongoliensis]
MNHFEIFHQLHHQKKPFILANAWNVKSAQLIEEAGFEAVGTSSGAIASSLGYEDGEKLPFNELLYIVRRIKACTSVPLSVDIERGYSDNLSVLSDNIQKLIDIGVSGLNIEDTQGEDIFLRKLECIKNYLIKTNQALFINARTDGFLQKLPSPLETTLKRAKLYQNTGADGLFVTAVPDAATIKEITSSVSMPVNIVGTSKFSIETLTSIGVSPDQYGGVTLQGHLRPSN